MENKKITYVFISGRKKRLLNNQEKFAKEFFYGFDFFNNNYDTKLIEFKDNSSIFTPLYKLLNKLSDLPIYGNLLVNKENYKLLKNTDELILTNQKTAFTILPLLLIVKIRKKVNAHVFIMGLFGKQMKYKIKSFFRNIFIYILILSSKKLIFLGKGEFDFATNKYKNFKHKFELLPFSVDLEFWKPKKVTAPTSEILFIGNDGMRDYEFLDRLTNKLTEYKFKIVSTKVVNNSVNKNVEYFNGSWDSSKYSDTFIHDLYKSASLTILPIKNTLQPSGQSVALQSIACGTPVLITKTDGFWDPEVFKDEENIFFMDSNNLSDWSQRIVELLNSPDKLFKVASNGIETMKKNYDLEVFHKKVEHLIIN